jgi:RNA polymerase sigma factor (sigma-70 family)
MVALAKSTSLARGPARTALEALPPCRRALVQEALEVSLVHIPNSLFASASAERVLFEEGPEIAPAPTGWYHPVLEARLAGRPRRSGLLTLDEERRLFLRYNYARRRAADAIARFGAAPSRDLAQAIALWYGRVKDTRDTIARANLALVLAMAKRHSGGHLDFGDLVSEGNLALLRAIDGFDVARGFKFSTYACRVVIKAFCRLAARAGRYRAAFPTEFDAALERPDERDDKEDQQEVVGELLRILNDNRAQLSPVEQTVLQSRFALHGDHGASAMTLEEVSRVVGVTRERVRQIQNKALAKLRAALEKVALLP